MERDHLISDFLSAIADRWVDRLHFIGGTALARTHLPNGRLSEDIDLVALGSRDELAAELDAELPRAIARTHGRLSWGPGLFRRHGQTNRLPGASVFETPPTTADWLAQLGGQTRLTVGPVVALARVRDAWEEASES